MLYSVYGSDLDKSLEKATTLVETLRAKKPDAPFVKVTGENWNKEIISEHLGGQGLFSSKYIIFLDRVMQDKAAEEELPEYFESMNESENIFILLEGDLKAEYRKKINKNSIKAVECEKVKFAKNGKTDFNIFALGDAMGRRDAMKSWMLYRQSLDQGFEPENIIGTLFWQIKAIISASKANTAGEAGLSPFVYANSKKFASNYSEDELRNLSRKLIEVYHDSHRGLADSETSIEALMLSLGRR